jgi:hypothetical protein
MAVLIELRVASATQDDHAAGDLKVSEAMDRLGGPPAGLMFHLAVPDGDGFVLMDVWRDETQAREFYDTFVRPALAELGVRTEELRVRPVWGMANPAG